MTPEQVIESYARRFTIEETFKDLKEIEGLGKPQVRSLELVQNELLAIYADRIKPEIFTELLERLNFMGV